MEQNNVYTDDSWQAKPDDRWIMKWIKINIAAKCTPKLLKYEWLQPWMITLLSSIMGMLAGLIFAVGWGFGAGCFAAAAELLDCIDGQFARLTQRETKEGMFWESILNRYSENVMLIGLVIYLTRIPGMMALELLIIIGVMALIGTNLISYSSSKAANLGIDLGKPAIVTKGIRVTTIVVCAWGSLSWPGLPVAALLYIAIHTNIVIAGHLIRTFNMYKLKEK